MSPRRIALDVISAEYARFLWHEITASLDDPARHYGPEWVGRHPRAGHTYVGARWEDEPAVLGFGYVYFRSVTTAVRGLGLLASWRHQGIGGRLSIALTGWVFDTYPQVHKIEDEVYTSNPASLAMMRRVGYWTEEGVQRETIAIDGQWVDRVLIGVTRPEWERFCARTREVGSCSAT